MTALAFDVQQAVALVRAGKSYTEIGPLLGVSGSAVIQYFRRHPELPRSQRSGRGFLPLRRCWECQHLTRESVCPTCATRLAC